MNPFHVKEKTLGCDFRVLETLPSTVPVYVDMGCGVGDYLLHRCPEDSKALWLGVDIAKSRIEKTTGRLLRKGISNAWLFCGDGQDLLACLPENSVSEININFPDPWLKSKQWKNRLFRPSFVVDILRVLKQGGELSFVSDISAYAQSVAALLEPIEGWKSIYTPTVKENVFESLPTLFYRKMSPLRPVSYLRFVKE